MKRIISIFLSILMVFSLFPAVYAASVAETTIDFDLNCDGEHSVTVPTGTEVTVTCTLHNMTESGEPFKVKTIASEIYYDVYFFELVEDSLEKFDNANAVVLEGIPESVGMKGDHIIQFNGSHTPNGKDYEDGKIHCRFKLRVIAPSGQSVVSVREMGVFYGPAYQSTSQDLTIRVGDAPTEVYDVVYVDNDISKTKTVEASGPIEISEPLGEKHGFEFLGWEYNGKLYQSGDMFDVKKDVTFTAKWQEIVQITNYTLTFETNGGTAVEKVTAPEGTVVDLSTKTTNKTGHEFKGWYEDANFKTPVSKITLDSDKTVYAKFVLSDKPSYTLTFETNGGSPISSVSRIEGTAIDLSEYKPSKDNYTFEGWYSDKDFKNKVTSITLDANKTVYAKWTENSGGGGNGGGNGGGGGGGGSTVTNYTITLKNPDDTVLGTSVQKSNTNVDLSQFKFTKEGYVLEGWYTNKELSEKITSLKLTADTILYAKWVKDGSPTPSKPGYHPEMLTTEHYAYVMGRDGGLICPLENITRAEVATIFFRLLTNEAREAYITNENTFNDVSSDAWYNTEVSTLANLGIVKGRAQDTFDPNAYITRAEFTTIAARFSDGAYSGEDFFTDIDGHWAQEYINTAANLGWVVGDNGIFRPDDNITRAEVMTLVNRVLNRQPESVDDMLEGMIEYPDNMDKDAWYYLAVQEAANSHEAEMKFDGIHEKWTALTENPDWEAMEKLN